MSKHLHIFRSMNRPQPRRLDDLTRAWGETTGRAIFEYEASRTAHSHAIARLAEEAQR